jgi:hypothetical protein
MAVAIILSLASGVLVGWYLGRGSSGAISHPPAAGSRSADSADVQVEECDDARIRLRSLVTQGARTLGRLEDVMELLTKQRSALMIEVASEMSVLHVQIEELPTPPASQDLRLAAALAGRAAAASKEGAQQASVALATGEGGPEAPATLAEGSELWREANSKLASVLCL